MERRVGMTAEPYSQGRGGGYVRAGNILSGIEEFARVEVRGAQPSNGGTATDTPDACNERLNSEESWESKLELDCC
jgi:hypothetical protein